MAADGDTDWNRVRALTDRDIDAAIADDPDAATLSDTEIARYQVAQVRYEITHGTDDRFHWRMIDQHGAVMAQDGGGFGSRTAALAAVEAVRQAPLSAELKAA